MNRIESAVFFLIMEFSVSVQNLSFTAKLRTALADSESAYYPSRLFEQVSFRIVLQLQVHHQLHDGVRELKCPVRCKVFLMNMICARVSISSPS